jgi:hypothetical protein
MIDLSLLKKPIIEKTAWILFAFSLSLDVITTLFLVHRYGLQTEENIYLREILSHNSLYYIPVACTGFLGLYILTQHLKKKSQRSSIPGRDLIYLIFLSIPVSLAFVEFTIAYHNLYLLLGIP